jgi:molybdopterin-containing oxidoreductase family iron-sulfur binding subunit
MSPLGKTYWRSLDELADTQAFRRFVESEFPALSEKMLSPTSRRSFLRIMGASMALAGMTGCRWPKEEILPHSQRPDGYSPGTPLQYATAMELGGCATGLLVTSYDGRPVKIEGNPLHPQSRGAVSPKLQASLLELYDPDRDDYTDWAAFESFALGHFGSLRRNEGRGLRVLSEASSSPSLAAMRARLLEAFPEARWFEYEPTSRDNERAGTALAFGTPHRPHFEFENAEVVVALDEDFLLQHPTAIGNARDWVAGRDPENGLNPKLVVYESGFSVTGAAADQRIALPAAGIAEVALRLAAALFLEHGVELPAEAAALRPLLEKFRGSGSIDVGIAADLAHHGGHGLVLAGPRQPAEVHALVAVINQALGNVGHTVSYSVDPDPTRPHHVEAITELTREMAAGRVDTLLILGGNPLFDAPADLDFAAALAKVGTSIRLGAHQDETSQACTWHLPRAHYLETWGDARGYDGTLSVAQPLIEPLFEGRSAIELLALLLGEESTEGYEIVRRTFEEQYPGQDWRRALHDGLVEGSDWPVLRPALRAVDWSGALADLTRGGATPNEIELVFIEDPAIHDGRFANNGWLMELPDPLTKVAWDNAALVAPATARELGLEQDDVIAVRVGQTSVELPVFVAPGQPKASIAVHLGYGRRNSGRVGTGAGSDVYPLRTTATMGWTRAGVTPTGRRYELATTQDHWAIDQRGADERERRSHVLVREVDLAEYREDPEAALHHGHEFHPIDLWRPHEFPGHRWGMAIDLNACIGCNGCVVACQSENNIPVVGKEELGYGRDMHWMRIDRYYSGDPDSPAVAHQPVTCHHCENAPCEQVCPVAATVHDSEGLNVMVYNRCIGTRYCSNNCPYKVRRFNYFNNHKNEQAVEMMIHNPEVTVRSRGVMEKCTFCVQRINAAKIKAKNERRTVHDGEVTTACQQACPTQAITFGDLNDPESRVRKLHEHDRGYAMIEEINIRPRTRYLARVRNSGKKGHA